MTYSWLVANFANAPHSLFYFWWFILWHAHTRIIYRNAQSTTTQPTDLVFCSTPFAHFVQIKYVCVSVHHSIYMESESAKYCVRQIWCQFCRFKFIYFHGTCISFSYYRYWSIYLTSLFRIKSIDAKPYLFTHNSKCETHGRNPFLTHIFTIFIEPHFSFHLCQMNIFAR